jgi:hypothetical protein
MDELWVSLPRNICLVPSELITRALAMGWIGSVSLDISRHSTSADIDWEEPAHDPDEDV